MKKKKKKQANTGGVNKDSSCILFTSLSVADRQSLSHIFVQNEGFVDAFMQLLH